MRISTTKVLSRKKEENQVIEMLQWGASHCCSGCLCVSRVFLASIEDDDLSVDICM